MIIIRFIQGFLMALADSVPGVSGGTIAFIMGFYDDFINSINTLASRQKSFKEKKAAIFFLLKIGIGWVVGLALSVFLLASIFEKEIYTISSLFLGLIVFSIPLIIVEEKKALSKNYFHAIFLIIGAVFVYAITYLSSHINAEFTTDKFSLIFGLYVFVAGMVAISAMVLPGISGSSFLLIFGIYSTIILSVKEVLSFQLSSLPTLFFFGCGIIVGAMLFIGLLRYLLDRHRSPLVYLILGLMIGSIYAVILGPTTLDNPQPALSFKTFNVIFFLLGGAIIYLLDELKHMMERINKNKLK